MSRDSLGLMAPGREGKIAAWENSGRRGAYTEFLASGVSTFQMIIEPPFPLKECVSACSIFTKFDSPTSEQVWVDRIPGTGKHLV